MAHSFNHKNVPQAERKLVRDTRRSRLQATNTKRAPEREGWSFMDSSFAAPAAGRFISTRRS